LTIEKPLTLEKVSDNVFKCNGTPVDCVSLGLCVLNIDFDLVVSGCNHGWNISYDTMYSGTVGACQEAMMFFTPAIAFSAESHSDMSEVDAYFDEVWKYIFANDLASKDHILNINFPRGEVKGISLGSLYYRHDKNFFVNKDGQFFAYRHLQEDFSDNKESDCYQVEHGIISIVPLSNSYFDEEILKKLNKKIKK
jgi:5'-nucleotidase